MSIIIGFGTGRCGTVSLAEWFDCFHEWKTPGGNEYLSELEPHDQPAWLISFSGAVRNFNKTRGDISLDHINNLEYWLKQKDATLIGVMRDADETVNSIKHYKTRRIWQKLFPQFDFEVEEDIYKFWDWYYETLIENNIPIIDIEQIPIIKNEGKYEKANKSKE